MTSYPTTACHLVDEFIKSCSSLVSNNSSPRVAIFLTDSYNCQHRQQQYKTPLLLYSGTSGANLSQNLLVCTLVYNIFSGAKLHLNSIYKMKYFKLHCKNKCVYSSFLCPEMLISAGV